MKFYTKEWHELMDKLGTAEMFEPVIDKEYTDEEIEDLYEDLMEKYVQEEHDDYDTPPYLMLETDEEDFDPDEFLILVVDEDGEEIEVHHPESYEEYVRHETEALAAELEEFENRMPFDEDEARREFEEDYLDNLNEPDEDIPQWIRDTVDPRLVALWVLPEGAYKKLMAEEEEMQERFDVLDAAADDALEEMYENLPEQFETLIEDLDELNGDYVAEIESEEGDLSIILAGWDEDGEDVLHAIQMEDAEILEFEEIEITSGYDEDGDFISDCSLTDYELYFEDDCLEIHFLLDNEEQGLKYVTVRCSGVSISEHTE